ncbi:formimidoylglutamase (plasmid) [Fulvitalea axinellae]|uniref:Formimidoylglutamase n=1 Tax=Fulvitalea axinellae TaxID=1182444 RepID=A0AAU9CSC2_9BACT|nr:formimidoylglutamase [Fulvitalea axinellae]
MKHTDFYIPTAPGSWTGRVDSEKQRELMRWHQAVRTVDLTQEEIPKLGPGQKGVALIGYKCQEGVRRNKGRLGAINGPDALRKVASSFPVHFPEDAILLDLGNVICQNNDLEICQNTLAEICAEALAKGYFPAVIGGGHDIAYGHFLGLRKNFPNESVGIINFDAHFDLREPDKEFGTSSGTPFLQIAHDEQKQGRILNYMCLGIQKNGNTRKLFDTADELGVKYIEGKDFHAQNATEVSEKIQRFIDSVQHVYLTTCLDAFASAFAPGVSATAYSGIIPDTFYRQTLDKILTSEKLRSMDIAELNPEFDQDNRTAKLAGSILFDYVDRRLS